MMVNTTSADEMEAVIRLVLDKGERSRTALLEFLEMFDRQGLQGEWYYVHGYEGGVDLAFIRSHMDTEEAKVTQGVKSKGHSWGTMRLTPLGEELREYMREATA
jgi:hypothetical protein